MRAVRPASHLNSATLFPAIDYTLVKENVTWFLTHYNKQGPWGRKNTNPTFFYTIVNVIILFCLILLHAILRLAW